MFVESVTISAPFHALGQAAEGVARWAQATSEEGKLLGCWRTEIGSLGRLLLLRRFETHEDMMLARRRALLDPNPFNVGSVVRGLEIESYEPFIFQVPAPYPDQRRIYEFRTYTLKPGGLKPTIALWEAALGPAHEYTRHLALNMYSLGGTPRIMHVWGFKSFEERADLRKQAFEKGTWPPPGISEQISEAISTVAVPLPGFPSL